MQKFEVVFQICLYWKFFFFSKSEIFSISTKNEFRCFGVVCLHE